MVVAKLKEEADLKLQNKKPRKRKRVENAPTRKKPKSSDIKPEVGSGDQPMIQVKKESKG